jgi:hypothetical protein
MPAYIIESHTQILPGFCVAGVNMHRVLKSLGRIFFPVKFVECKAPIEPRY